MLSLKKIACKKLLEILPKECRDDLIKEEINSRTVYLVDGKRIFSDLKAAEKLVWYHEYDDAAHHRALPVLLEEKPKNRIFAEQSHLGVYGDGPYVDYICARKKQIKKIIGQRRDPKNLMYVLKDGEWVWEPDYGEREYEMDNDENWERFGAEIPRRFLRNLDKELSDHKNLFRDRYNQDLDYEEENPGLPLPLEVICIVAEHLTLGSMMMLMSTCKDWYITLREKINIKVTDYINKGLENGDSLPYPEVSREELDKELDSWNC